MKIFKRTLSLILAVLILTSINVTMASAVSKTAPREGKIKYIQRDAYGNPVIDNFTHNPQEVETTQKYGTRPVITEVVNSDPEIYVKTRKYRFYMPDNWRNDHNDNYDGENLDSCAAGIYWWGTTYNSDDFKNGIPDAEGKTEYDNAQGWPGYRVLEQDPDDPHIFVCEVPEDCGTIIFNNLVDGGPSPVNNPAYGLCFQTFDIPTTYTSPNDDKYGFYTKTKDGKEISADNPMIFDDMIYVVDPENKNNRFNDYSGATSINGDWFYYYGDGKYGTTPDMGDSYFANGDFPSELSISNTNISINNQSNSSFEIYCNANPENLSVISENPSVATSSVVSSVTNNSKWKSKVSINAVSNGVAIIVFKYTNPQTNNMVTRTCLINVNFDKIQPTNSEENDVLEIKNLINEGYALSSDSSPNAYIWINRVLNTNEKYPSSFVYSKIKSEAEEAQSNTNISTFNCKNKILAYLECLIDEINKIEYKGLSELIEEGNNISDNSSSRAYKWIIDILKTISQYSNSSVYSKIKSEAEEAQSNTNISTFNCKNKILAYLIILKDEIGETQPTEPTKITEPTQATESTQNTKPTEPEIKDISNWKVYGITNKTYTGKAITQKNIIVSNGSEVATVKIQYANNINAGTATIVLLGTGDYSGTIVKTFKINKANNPITVKTKAITAKAKSNTSFAKTKAFTITKAQGTVSFKKVSGDKKITITKAGKITVKKGLKKGKTYSFKVKVTAAGNNNYKAGSKTVTVKIKVK